MRCLPLLRLFQLCPHPSLALSPGPGAVGQLGAGGSSGEQPPPLGPELLPPSPVLQTRFPLPQLREERPLFACLLGQRVWEGVRAL